ncbi:reverse transcriptase [Senna tora]|uniref:Reverse transcriptase n=1 Tax=Senna tora TaxID=362788 RepID=A0A834TII5_9FABA|nr:reverse transcriptase [Senna tora]
MDGGKSLFVLEACRFRNHPHRRTTFVRALHIRNGYEYRPKRSDPIDFEFNPWAPLDAQGNMPPPTQHESFTEDDSLHTESIPDHVIDTQPDFHTGGDPNHQHPQSVQLLDPSHPDSYDPEWVQLVEHFCQNSTNIQHPLLGIRINDQPSHGERQDQTLKWVGYAPGEFGLATGWPSENPHMPELSSNARNKDPMVEEVQSTWQDILEVQEFMFNPQNQSRQFELGESSNTKMILHTNHGAEVECMTASTLTKMPTSTYDHPMRDQEVQLQLIISKRPQEAEDNMNRKDNLPAETTDELTTATGMQILDNHDVVRTQDDQQHDDLNLSLQWNGVLKKRKACSGKEGHHLICNKAKQGSVGISIKIPSGGKQGNKGKKRKVNIPEENSHDENQKKKKTKGSAPTEDVQHGNDLHNLKITEVAQLLQDCFKGCREVNRHEFSNISTQIQDMEASLQAIQAQIHLPQNQTMELHYRKRLEFLLNCEEIMWAQRAQQMWLVKGDRNTRYFHTLVNHKRNKARIKAIQGGDQNWIEDPTLIKEAAKKYFIDLYTSNSSMDSDQRKVIVSYLVQAEHLKHIQGPKIGRQVQPLNHLMYADDLLIFFKVKQETCANVDLLLNIFGQASGLFMNKGKSKIKFSPNTSENKKNFLSIINCKGTDSIGKYLGAFIDGPNLDRQNAELIIDHLQQKLTGWKASMLSQAARFTLIQAFLSAIPLYTLHFTSLTDKYAKKCNSPMNNFFWGNWDDGKNTHLIAWD